MSKNLQKSLVFSAPALGLLSTMTTTAFATAGETVAFGLTTNELIGTASAALIFGVLAYKEVVARKNKATEKKD